MKKLVSILVVIGLSILEISAVEDVVIVGGGLSGLTCAYELKKEGVDAVVYEAQERLGGRVKTEYREDGSYYEIGGEEFDHVGHEVIVDLSYELGLELEEEGMPWMVVMDGGRQVDMRQYIGELRKLRTSLLLMGRCYERTIDFIDDQVKDEQLNRFVKLYFGELAELDMEDPFDDRAQKKLMGLVYYVEYLNMTNGDVCQEDPSYACSLRELGGEGYFEWMRKFNTTYGFVVKGGNVKLVEALASHVRVEKGHELVKLSKEGEVYRMEFMTAGGLVEVEAKEVVLTIPLSVMRAGGIDFGELELPEAFRKVMEKSHYASYTKVMVPLENRFWRDKGRDTFRAIDMDEDILVLDNSIGQDKASLLFFFRDDSGERSYDDIDEVLEKYKVLGLVRDKTREIEVHSWKDDKYANGAYPWNDYGAPSKLHEELLDWAEPFEGLYFGGEHTLVDWGFMNSAVRSGQVVAELLRDK